MPSPILQLIHRVVEDQRTREASDELLLRQFTASRDDKIFHALVCRHGPMVLDVCRAVLPNEADAEDAFQATFLILALKPGSIRKAAALASWLHGVAYRTALKSQSEFAKRRKHEARVVRRDAVAGEDLSWGDVQRALHEELTRLSEDYRAPLSLCYLQGKTQDEAARLLGLAKGTLKGRLERARAVLRKRLIRRGFGPAAVLLASAWPAATASAGLPPTLVRAAIKTALMTAAERTATVTASATVVALAEGVMRAMAFSKMKTPAAVVFLMTVLSLGGGMVFWQSPAREKGPGVHDARQAEEMKSKQGEIATVVGRFVERLKQHPARPHAGEGALGLHLMDVQEAEVTLIAAAIDDERAYCGSPCWSSDGRHILFDASPGQQWSRTRLQMLEGTDTGVTLSGLGPGNCPTLSPDGNHIAYLLNPDSVLPDIPDVKPGICVMKTDGSDWRRLGEPNGIPKWSPDGRHVLTVSFANPCQLTLMNVATGEDLPVQFPGHKVYSVPSWVGDDTIVAVVGSPKGVVIALVDVSNANEAKLKEVLWKKGDGLVADPMYPVYSPRTRRGVFVGREQKGQALYSFEPGKAPQRFEPNRYDRKIASLALSPDGRHLLFCSERSAQPLPAESGRK